MTGAGGPALRAVGGTGPGDAVIRRQRFEQAHPGITITPPETHASMWIARQDSRILCSDYQLGALLDALEWLAGKHQEEGATMDGNRTEDTGPVPLPRPNVTPEWVAALEEAAAERGLPSDPDPWPLPPA